MQTIHLAQTIGRLVAWTSAALLASGSIGLAAPAFAERSSTGEARSAHGQAQKQANLQQDQGRDHGRPTARAGDGGRADVSLPRPNDFRAQADPDGLENGGVDQPGGQGGVDVTAQDGNNGTGNDSDCEDDNNGLGLPGHCTERPAPVIAPVDDTAGDTDVASVIADVLAPTGGSAGVVVSPAGTTVPPAVRTGVLPDTGTGRALLSLAVAALTALALGGGLLLRGRRSASG
ncbi:MAG TPA: LPXTG cell wall anchor domain-containing protein [Marmoricola sp.]